MKKQLALTAIVSIAAIIATVSCRRSDVRTMVIDVPEMDNAVSVRIVTNAALDEIVGQYDGVKNNCEVDLKRNVVVYHEGQRLLSPEYQRQIEARIAEVGFNAKMGRARHNPPPPVRAKNGVVQQWPGRFTSVISVPDMVSNTDANIVVDAIAYARLGRDDPRVSVDHRRRRIVASYESLHLSLKSIEHAIACTGFDANGVPARLGFPDSVPHGWTAVKL